MLKMNNLEAKGRIDYNYVDDILYFYIDRLLSEGVHKYEHSFDLDGFIIDIDRDSHVIGIELLDASKKLNVNKILLKFIKKGNLSAKIEKDIISISFSFMSVLRNKPMHIVTSNIERPNTVNLKETGLECQILPAR